MSENVIHQFTVFSCYLDCIVFFGDWLQPVIDDVTKKLQDLGVEMNQTQQSIDVIRREMADKRRELQG